MTEQTQSGEELAAADTEEIGDGARLAVREQQRVHALLQAGTPYTLGNRWGGLLSK